MAVFVFIVKQPSLAHESLCYVTQEEMFMVEVMF